ncbi:hypothetical protein KC19_10G180900 [Ceratodon purpureus]|uniref:Uncharacterized protein n=1 Tax=Ceratodon purpureus TaxID=3225 RepID=A0A8T0GN50_CERPU|nr:hypothetical protein KC19_10G180900 [Ceratodon purpureus]
MVANGGLNCRYGVSIRPSFSLCGTDTVVAAVFGIVRLQLAAEQYHMELAYGIGGLFTVVVC